MNTRLSALLISATFLLTACASAPQLPLPVAPQAFAAPANNYGVVLAKMPVVDTQFPGASCLLCLAAASVANSDLTKYTKTLPADDLAGLNKQVAEVLKKRGAKVTMIDQLDLSALPDSGKGVNFAYKDFSSLKAKYNIDKLVVVNFRTVGIERTYAAYIPNGDPKATIVGESYIVNLNDNSLEWFQRITAMKASDGKWDEPPKFPGLTNAYYQVIELAKDSVLTPLAQ
ncbi:hypothetical protein Q4S45_18795 [Massilia sp. R2A-15]|uniref:hypothetical protein n=1 Tax=Massilia sp. R2A-15 TaxID=3064278 RepID=UPI002732FE26|nr:hypothetical protein [Massilia sp. R2A-15]WLI88746.1 hypothetical protein Q4S45_18795 [Massilia sp. R2A-15]